jgi:predicted transposase/invertase (TIGR01784 family)
MGAILKEGRKPGSKGEIAAYLDVVLRANPKTFLEVQKMKYPTMEELLTEAGLLPGMIERGRAQGMEKGIEQEKLEIAWNFKKMGLSLSQIAEGTGLSPDIVEKL